jgi:hypothetical protein
MVKKCSIINAEIKLIRLCFNDNPTYVYYGKVSKRLTKKLIVFLDQWRDAINECDDDRLDSLYQNNIETIINYLNECQLDKYIDLDEWDTASELPDTSITNTCCKACRVHEQSDPHLEFVLSCGCTLFFHL